MADRRLWRQRLNSKSELDEQTRLWTLFVLAVIPNPLFDLAGIVAGATKIPIYKYFIVVALGKIVKFGVFSYLGANSIGLIDKYI
jgi:uncharacterized membrane protein YdjX (TVP38/TMEM64 family)